MRLESTRNIFEAKNDDIMVCGRQPSEVVEEIERTCKKACELRYP